MIDPRFLLRSNAFDIAQKVVLGGITVNPSGLCIINALLNQQFKGGSLAFVTTQQLQLA